MTTTSLFLLLCLLFGSSRWSGPPSGVADASRYPPLPPKPDLKPQPKPPNIDIEGLPDLKDVLTELNLQDFMPKFVRAGIVETRLLLRLGPTDFGIMDWDWEMPLADIARLREHINVLIVKATIPERDDTREKAEAERARLQYGRVYLPDAVQVRACAWMKECPATRIQACQPHQPHPPAELRVHQGVVRCGGAHRGVPYCMGEPGGRLRAAGLGPHGQDPGGAQVRVPGRRVYRPYPGGSVNPLTHTHISHPKTPKPQYLF